MIQIVKVALSVCVIFLIVSCATTDWDWNPKPYVADHEYQSILYIDENNQEFEILCSDPQFTDFTCFSPDNPL